MGATLDSIIAGENPVWDFVIAIEGYPYLLTTGDPQAAIDAWSGTDWALALGGLEINWSQRQELDPWNPFAPGSSLVFKVMDTDGTDRFGVDVHRREGGVAARIAADVGPEDTEIVVQRSDDFPSAPSDAYLGCEAFVYGTNTTASETFSNLVRGMWSPFYAEGDAGGRFARSHRVTRVAEGVPPDATAVTMVRTHPTEWAGKWVGVWIHANRGGVLDVKAEAHLAFAGRIAAPIRDTADGLTVVSCDDVRQTLQDTVILRHQFKARLKEGIYLFSGTGLKFDCYTERLDTATNAFTSENADPLRVVLSGAAGAYQIDEGWYTLGEIASAINRWLSQARADSDCLYRLSYNAHVGTEQGQRPSLRLDDPSDGAVGDRRFARVTANNLHIRRALGWEETIPGGISVGPTNQPTATNYGASAPVRLQGDWVPYETTAQLRLEQVTGEFVNQVAYLNPTMQQAGFGAGVLRIGDDFFVCDAPSITNGEGTVNVRRIRELDQAIGATFNKLRLTVEDSGDIHVAQVLMLEGSPLSLVMTLLCSTGSANYNSTLFDLLPAQCGAGVPWSLLTADFEAELAAAAGGTEPMTVVVSEPTKLVDLWNVSFILRGLALVWRQGRLALRGWATPTSAATLEFTEDDKATPVDMSHADNQRAVAELTDKWLRNVIRIQYNRDLASDSYRDTYNVIGVDGGWGEKRRTLEARNAVRGGGFLAGENIDGLLPTFVGSLSFLTRHAHIVRVPVAYSKFETHTPGEILLLTDSHLRDPSTGERGVTGKPALIVGQSFDWGGPTIGTNGRDPDVQEVHGHIDLMLFPQMSLAPYCPTAEVDSTLTGSGFDAGYNSGTLTLRMLEHAHSESWEAADASHLAAGDEVFVMEIDPADPAAPLNWTDTIDSVSGNDVVLTVGLAGWDNTKKYRVFAQGYGLVQTSQKSKAFQADDADGLVADSREPYGYSHGIQATTGTAIAATALPARHANLAFGDGRALASGYAWDVPKNLNNLVSYKTAPQVPSMYSETATFSGGGTWQLKRARWFALGRGRLDINRTRKLWVAPRFKSATGASVSVRVSLCRSMPKSADTSSPSLDDILRVGPYTEVTFTTSDTNYVVPSADDLDIRHLVLDAYASGGWLLVEITANCIFDGLAECWLGPLVSP
ncbi:MAG: hypothetical protein F9K40_05320 [Kofleriaceae bacterium]|nr:MAG: hypothetical protein F9K40_05320 [Kofleriaceae bacterium]